VQHQGAPETVRLIGVDTPEMNDPRPSVNRFAEESKWFTERVALNQQLRMDVQKPPKERDRYGRLLAFAYRQDGALINRMIIREGFGFAYLKYPFDSLMMEQFANEERDARENMRGLWGPVRRKIADLTTPKDDPRAESWIGIGDNLRKTNADAARDWYRGVLDKFPKSTSASVARKRLMLPEPAPERPKPLTEDVALSVIADLSESETIQRPDLPDPPAPTWIPKPAPARQSQAEANASADSSSDLNRNDGEPSSRSYGLPSSRSSANRRSPGTEVHVRGYTRKNGTYVAPHTRSAPRRR
jgi:endonuclease YncB( thermonuclease family)